MPKRSLSEVSSPVSEDEPLSRQRRLTTSGRLRYPNCNSAHTVTPPPFQKPMPILSFSYDPSRTLLFDDSAMRYFVDPPIGAELSYGYDRWIRRPEEKGRLDGLLKAYSRAKIGRKVDLSDVAVVSWRGVMTKYVASRFVLCGNFMPAEF